MFFFVSSLILEYGTVIDDLIRTNYSIIHEDWIGIIRLSLFVVLVVSHLVAIYFFLKIVVSDYNPFSAKAEDEYNCVLKE
ncbi:MAG: hypothetical protein A3F91_09670 [Flavobacteria bacterium RIFCSPLOWO2_12_FULL_35_11]|nr:MAG: hypothetical protein A3F91_09670 [Flavobacteria bacterium RIFCSPLOWO2_12_FULL_35_11]